MRFVAYDTETGGLDPRQHAIVTIGVALMDGVEVVDSREWLAADQSVAPKAFLRRDYCVGSLAISGVSHERIVNEGVSLWAIMRDLHKWARGHEVGVDTPIVSHNAPFDSAFLSDALFRLGEYDRDHGKVIGYPCPLPGPWVCTQRMFSNLYPCEPYSLDNCLARFDLRRDGELHGALEDAVLCGKLYAIMRREARLAQVGA